MEQKTNIELRSERALNIVGKVPSIIIRHGITVIVLSICSIIAIFSIVPYRENISIVIKMHKSIDFDIINSPADGFFITENLPRYVSIGQTIGFVANNDSLIVIRSSISGRLYKNVNIGDSISHYSVLCGVMANNNGVIYGESVISAETKAKINLGSKVTFLYLDQLITGYISIVCPTENKQFYTLMINFSNDIPLEIIDSQSNGHVTIEYKSILHKLISIFGS